MSEVWPELFDARMQAIADMLVDEALEEARAKLGRDLSDEQRARALHTLRARFRRASVRRLPLDEGAKSVRFEVRWGHRAETEDSRALTLAVSTLLRKLTRSSMGLHPA